MTWSYSQLSSFETCPLQHYEIKIAKNFQEQTHPTTAWGTRGHLALEERVRDGVPLPAEFAYLEGFAKGIIAMPGDTHCEHQIACTKDYRPTEFDSPDAWARGIIDVLKLRDTEAVVCDYKFGKIKPSAQLKLNALLLFCNFPMVQTVKTRFLWIAHRDKTEGVYHRKDMDWLWADFIQRAASLEQAKEEGIFNPRPSGLCKAHCPVSTCEFYKRGNRRY